MHDIDTIIEAASARLERQPDQPLTGRFIVLVFSSRAGEMPPVQATAVG